MLRSMYNIILYLFYVYTVNCYVLCENCLFVYLFKIKLHIKIWFFFLLIQLDSISDTSIFLFVFLFFFFLGKSYELNKLNKLFAAVEFPRLRSSFSHFFWFYLTKKNSKIVISPRNSTATPHFTTDSISNPVLVDAAHRKQSSG